MRLCSLCSVQQCSEEHIFLATDLLEINLYTNPRYFSLPYIFQRELLKSLGMDQEDDENNPEQEIKPSNFNSNDTKSNILSDNNAQHLDLNLKRSYLLPPLHNNASSAMNFSSNTPGDKDTLSYLVNEKLKNMINLRKKIGSFSLNNSINNNEN